MVPALCVATGAVPPPAYQRALARQPTALPLTALALVARLRLLDLCRLAVRLAHRRCPPPLPAGPGGKPRTDSEESLRLIALLRALWRLSYRDMRAWPAPARACGLPCDEAGRPLAPSPSQQCKRAAAAGAPPYEMRFVVAVRAALGAGLTRGRDLLIDSAPLLAWRRGDPDAASGHAPAHHPAAFLRGFRAHTLLCRGAGRCSSSSPRPTATTPPSPSSCRPGRGASTTRAPASSAWMRPTGACGWSTGSAPRSGRSS
jgi:hypothetical protein